MLTCVESLSAVIRMILSASSVIVRGGNNLHNMADNMFLIILDNRKNTTLYVRNYNLIMF